MAGRVIDAVLRLRDEFTKPMGKALDTMTQASKEGARVRRNIDRTAKSFQNVGKQLTTAVTLPIVGAGAAAVKTAADFETTMSQVQATKNIGRDAMETLNGSTVNAMDALSDLAKELGKSTKFSASEAAEAINNMAMAGYDVQKTYDTLPTVLSLASAGALDLDYATQLVANGMAVMGESCQSAQQMADQMAVVSTKAYGSVSDFGEALLTAGGQASICGQSMEDTFTALGILGDAGIQASEGGVALRNVLKNLYQPTEKASKVLNSLGISVDDGKGNLLSMQDVLQQLNGAMANMNDAQISTTMAQIFDTRTLAAADALLKNADDRWNTLRGDIAGASDLFDGKGAAAGMADIQLDNFSGQVTILKSSLEGLAISFGELLLPYVKEFAEKVQGLVDKLNAMTPEQKEQVVRMAAMAAAIGPLIFGFGKLIGFVNGGFKAFAALRKAMTFVTTAGGPLKAVFAALSGPMGIVVAIAAAIGVAIAVVVTHFEEFKQAAANVAEVVQPHIERLSEAFSGFSDTVGPVIQFISDLLAETLVGAFEGAAEGIGIAIDGVTLVITGIQDVVQGIVDFVVAITNGDWSAAWDGLGGIVTGVFETISGLIEGVSGLVVGLVDAVNGAASRVGSWLGGKVGKNAAGTNNWRGGLTTVNEQGGEIIDLPQGTRIYPHDKSVAMARAEGASLGGGSISIAKLADQIVVREDADIDRIANAIADKLTKAREIRGGWTFSGNMA